MSLPSGLTAAENTVSVCPVSVRKRHEPSDNCQMRAVLSAEVVTLLMHKSGRLPLREAVDLARLPSPPMLAARSLPPPPLPSSTAFPF